MLKKNYAASLIFLIFVLLLLFIPILAQKYEYNKYLILLNGIPMFFGAIFLSYLLYTLFINLQFEKGKLKQNILPFIKLVLIYYLITLYVSIGIFGTLSSFLQANVWEIFPEYRVYIIPTFSLSLLLLCRIFGLFKEEFQFLQLFKMSLKEIRNSLRDIVVGTLIISSAAVFFVGAGVHTITEYKWEFNSFVLISSLIVATIEVLIWYLKNNLHNEFQLYTAKSQAHSVKEKSQNKAEGIVNRHPKLVYLLLITVLFLAFVWVTNYQISTNLNTTVLNINVKEISINITKTSINATTAVIPLAIVNGKEKPLTERIEYLINNNIASYEFLNKSLEALTEIETYPLNSTLKFKNSLNCDPTDYDATIIYALYKNGYQNFKLACSFKDYGTMVFSDKIFFNLNKKNNVTIYLHVTGATYSITDYEIKIVTQNETIGKNIKELLEDDRRKADIILINKDPIESPFFN